LAPRPERPKPAFELLPDATRKSLQALLKVQQFGEDEAQPDRRDADRGDPIQQLLLKQLPATTPFAWLEPENLMLPVCWKDPLTGPVEACCLLQRHKDAVPQLAQSAAIANPENLLVALEAMIVRKAERSHGDTAVVVADLKLTGETQEAVVHVIRRYAEAEAVSDLQAKVEQLWPQVLPLLKTVRFRGQRHLTTRYRLRQDQRFMAYLKRGDFFALPEFPVRGTEQQRVVALAVYDHLRLHGWSVLNGPGGAGKTFLLGQMAEALKGVEIPNDLATTLACPMCGEAFADRCFACGYVRCRSKQRKVSIALAAPTNRAVAVLRRVVDDLGGDIVCFTLHALAKATATFPVDVLVIDEASMLSAEHGDLIVNMVALRKACVLFVGDAAQLPPVGGGELLRPLLAAAQLPSLKVNMRAEASLAEPIRLVRDGDAGCMGAFTTACKDEASRQAAVFAAAEGTGGSRIVLAPLNDDRIAYCRYALKKLAPKIDARDDYMSDRPHPRLFVPFLGLPVRFMNNALKPNACSGMLGEIAAVSEEGSNFCIGVQVATPDGPRSVALAGSLQKLAFHLRPAYAVTVHDAQGGEFDRVDILMPASADCPLCTKELLYTAVSRARHRVAIWSLRTPFNAYVPKLSQASPDRVSPFATLLAADQRRLAPKPETLTGHA